MNLKEVQEFEIRHEIDCRILSPLDPLTRRLIHRHQPPTDGRPRPTPPKTEDILNFASVLPGDFSTSFIPDRDRQDIQPDKDRMQGANWPSVAGGKVLVGSTLKF